MEHRDDPTREEQLRIIEDPELQAERRAWRIEALPVPDGKMRGRRRAIIEEEKQLALSMPAVMLGNDKLQTLDRVIASQEPLFDQFTQHHRIKPTATSIEKYVNGGSNRKTKEGKSIGPRPIADFPLEERPRVIRARQRQYNYLCNSLQCETFDDRNIARSRRFALMATQFLIRTNGKLDEDAARMAADAVVDFGHTLNDKHNRQILDNVHDYDLGFQIIRIGVLADNDFGMLRTNQELLRVVQREQFKREVFWDRIYQATKKYFPKTRLLNVHRESGSQLQVELNRLAGICPPVEANLPPEPIIGDYESKKAA